MRIFLAGGESRHWIHTASPCKENGEVDENIPCGERDISAVRCPEPDRGGFSSVNENISGGRDTVQREEKYRGALTRL